MKRLIPALASIVFIFSCATRTKYQSFSLFNGKDLRGWHVDVPAMDTDTTAKNPFIVREGMLVSLGKPGGHLHPEHFIKCFQNLLKYK
jgi:hypothetical protein